MKKLQNNKSTIFKVFTIIIAILVLVSFILPYFYKGNMSVPDLTTKNVEACARAEIIDKIYSIKKLSECAYPLQYAQTPSSDGQFKFKSIISEKLDVKLIPNYENRKKQNIQEVSNIVGVCHFFLDHDLTSGYVHPYTLNFFNKLRPDDFVLKYTPSSNSIQEGSICYIRKKDIKEGDKLGKNLAFFRQWKLSEIDISGDKIRVATCKYAHGYVCPQVKPNCLNPFKLEIPIANIFLNEGYYSITNFSDFDRKNGGTAVIIWEDSVNNVVKFMDVHSSMQQIINEAIDIAKNYNVDPTIAISDAGLFSLKFKSDENYVLNTKVIDKVSDIPFVSAGFGYIPQKATEFEITFKDKTVKRVIAPNNSKAFKIYDSISRAKSQ